MLKMALRPRFAHMLLPNEVVSLSFPNLTKENPRSISKLSNHFYWDLEYRKQINEDYHNTRVILPSMDQKAFSQPFEGLEILFNTRYQNDEN